MKRLVCAVFLLALSVWFSLYSLQQIKSISSSLGDELMQVQKSYEENRENAKKDYDRFYTHFSEAEGYLCASLNHQEIDLLREAIAKTKSYLYSENEADFFCEFENLKRLIEHIGELEDLRPGNVL